MTAIAVLTIDRIDLGKSVSGFYLKHIPKNDRMPLKIDKNDISIPFYLPEYNETFPWLKSFKYTTVKRIAVDSVWGARCDFSLGWITENITNDNSIWVQVMA